MTDNSKLQRLREWALKWRSHHREIEDGWFSCGKASNFFGTGGTAGECDCGKDELDALLAEPSSPTATSPRGGDGELLATEIDEAVLAYGKASQSFQARQITEAKLHEALGHLLATFTQHTRLAIAAEKRRTTGEG